MSKKNSDFGVEFKVTPASQEGKTKAFVNMTIKAGDSPMFAVRDLKLIEGSGGLFVSFPNKRQGDDYKDIVFPLTKGIRDRVNELVKAEYERIISNTTSETGEEVIPF